MEFPFRSERPRHIGYVDNVVDVDMAFKSSMLLAELQRPFQVVHSIIFL